MSHCLCCYWRDNEDSLLTDLFLFLAYPSCLLILSNTSIMASLQALLFDWTPVPQAIDLLSSDSPIELTSIPKALLQSALQPAVSRFLGWQTRLKARCSIFLVLRHITVAWRFSSNKGALRPPRRVKAALNFICLKETLRWLNHLVRSLLIAPSGLKRVSLLPLVIDLCSELFTD